MEKFEKVFKLEKEGDRGVVVFKEQIRNEFEESVYRKD